MKINRLLEITIILLNKGTITAKELAQRFGVSTRTIYRDVDVLSSSGVPVYMNKGNGGGISLLEEYALNKALISEQESESLIMALKTMQATKYPEVGEVLNKLGAVFKNTDATDWVEIDYSPWGSNPNEYNKFNEIKTSILKRYLISFDYVSSYGESTKRTIEPMKLVFKGQSWYLLGYCKLKNDFRTFRISRIKNVKVHGEKFIRRKIEPVLKDNETMDLGRELVTLKLKFCKEAMYRVFDDFHDEVIVKNEDGTFIVTLTFPEDEWVYGYILSFGCYVEVLEPLHIKEIIKDRLKRTLEIYNVK